MQLILQHFLLFISLVFSPCLRASVVGFAF